jgi:hypothetical protein
VHLRVQARQGMERHRRMRMVLGDGMFHTKRRTSHSVSVVRVFSSQSRVNAQAVCSARR